MRKKIISFLLIGIFLFSQMSFAEARGRAFSGGNSFSIGRSLSSNKSFTKSLGGWSGSSSSSTPGKSFGGWSGSSSSKSFGSSGSSSSKSFGSFGSSGSSSYSGGSSSRKIPNIFGWGGSSSSSGSSAGGKSSSGGSTGGSKSSSGTSTKSKTLKNSYMEDAYKKEASQRSYNTYKQNLNEQQKKAYDSTMNRSYTMNNRMNFEDAMRTRKSRISMFDSRTVIINVNRGMFGGLLSYGSYSIGPWDLWFLMRASDLFWYHHWHELSAYKNHFDQEEYDRLEKRVQELERQNIPRDPNYLDPNVDPDLQFSEQYQEKNPDRIYYTNKHPGSVDDFAGTVVAVVILAVGLIIILKAVSKPKRKKPFRSRIY